MAIFERSAEHVLPTEEAPVESDISSPELPSSTVEAADEEPSGITRYGEHALRSAVIVAELTPINEAIRYGALAASLSQTRNPFVSAAVLGGTTMLVEGSAAVAAAGYVAENKVGQVLQGIRDRLSDKPWLSRFLQPKELDDDKEKKPSYLAEAGTALYVGTVGAMQLRQGLDTGRQVSEVRSHGLKTAAWLSGVLAVEGALIAEGVENAESPWVWGSGLALIGAAAVKKGVTSAFRHFRKEEAEPVAEPRYDLTAEELALLEGELVELAEQTQGSEAVVPILVPSQSRFANFIRTHEVKLFPEVETLDSVAEDDTVFLALVDTREGIKRVVHATTLSGYKGGVEDVDSQPAEADKSTGFIVTNDLVAMGNFTSQEFRDYYGARGYDLDKCFSIETNFNIGERVPLYNGMKSADLAYLTAFQMFIAMNPELGRAGVFASINDASKRSFERIGLQTLPIMGKDDLVTSESLRGQDYSPILIPYNEHSREIFAFLPPLNLVRI